MNSPIGRHLQMRYRSTRLCTLFHPVIFLVCQLRDLGTNFAENLVSRDLVRLGFFQRMPQNWWKTSLFQGEDRAHSKATSKAVILALAVYPDSTRTSTLFSREVGGKSYAGKYNFSKYRPNTNNVYSFGICEKRRVERCWLHRANVNIDRVTTHSILRNIKMSSGRIQSSGENQKNKA